jgi:hypothetical protein
VILEQHSFLSSHISHLIFAGIPYNSAHHSSVGPIWDPNMSNKQRSCHKLACKQATLTVRSACHCTNLYPKVTVQVQKADLHLELTSLFTVLLTYLGTRTRTLNFYTNNVFWNNEKCPSKMWSGSIVWCGTSTGGRVLVKVLNLQINANNSWEAWGKVLMKRDVLAPLNLTPPSSTWGGLLSLVTHIQGCGNQPFLWNGLMGWQRMEFLIVSWGYPEIRPVGMVLASSRDDTLGERGEELLPSQQWHTHMPS